MVTIYADVLYTTGYMRGNVARDVPQCLVDDADAERAAAHYSGLVDAAIELPLVRGGSAVIAGNVTVRRAVLQLEAGRE